MGTLRKTSDGSVSDESDVADIVEPPRYAAWNIRKHISFNASSAGHPSLSFGLSFALCPLRHFFDDHD